MWRSAANTNVVLFVPLHAGDDEVAFRTGNVPLHQVPRTGGDSFPL